jgi:hypothetical protein
LGLRFWLNAVGPCRYDPSAESGKIEVSNGLDLGGITAALTLYNIW